MYWTCLKYHGQKFGCHHYRSICRTYQVLAKSRSFPLAISPYSVYALFYLPRLRQRLSFLFWTALIWPYWTRSSVSLTSLIGYCCYWKVKNTCLYILLLACSRMITKISKIRKIGEEIGNLSHKSSLWSQFPLYW